MQEHAKYHFRRRDYAKIRSWYDFARQHFVPAQTPLPEEQPSQKREWHFRLMFREVLLTDAYVNCNMKLLFNIKRVVFLSSLFNKAKGSTSAYGKEISTQCEFDVNNMALKMKEEIILFFFVEATQPKDYQLCLEIQAVNHEGQLLKFGACRFPLLQRKDQGTTNVLAIFNSLFIDRKLQEELQTISQVQKQKKDKKDFEVDRDCVGRIQCELDTDEIKEVRKYLPPLRIINQQSKLPPTSFNLKKKKEQLVVEPPFQVLLQELLFKIEKPVELRQQLLSNNPFTLSHKDYVDLEVGEFRVLIDNHNGYKFMRENRNQLPLELVVNNESEIYISSKKIHKLNLHYYEADLVTLVLMLSCQVQFRLKGITEQTRKREFLIGWLPVPLDLAQRQNKIDLMMVNDIEFPTSIGALLGVPSHVNASFIHAHHHKYKTRQDQKKVFTEHLITDALVVGASNQYIKLKSRKHITDSLSSETEGKHHEAVEAQIRAVRSLIKERQARKEQEMYVKVNGLPELGQGREENSSMLAMQTTVGKYLKVKLQIDSLIPETNSPSAYYLPRKMKATIHFLRQTHHMSISINDNQARFHIPTRLNQHKQPFFFNSYVNSVEEYQNILNSRFLILFYEEDDERLYAKAITSAHDILGAVEADQLGYVRLFKWTQSGYKIFGKVLVSVGLELLNKNNRFPVQEMNVNKVLYKMPLEERLKMRIGCFKGDETMKRQAVSLVKKRQHSKYVESVVLDELVCEGEMQYQIGKDVYYLLPFTNENKSQLNSFTFHLSSPYAEIVTDEQEYRSTVQSLNFEQLGYQRLALVLQQPVHLSYYETSLRYNQQIGLLVKLNVNEYSEKGPLLDRLEVVVKRNTIEAKRYLIRCKYQEPMVYDVVYDYAVDTGEGSMVLPLEEEIRNNYKQITVLDKFANFNQKTKEITIERPRKNIKLMITALPATDHLKSKRIILYNLLILPGKQLCLSTGEPHALSLSLEEKAPVQVLRCSHPQVTITNCAKFAQKEYNAENDLIVRPLRPFVAKNYVIGCYDLTGAQLSLFLLKVESQLRLSPSKLEIIYESSSNYSVVFDNPYACQCSFEITSSCKAVRLEDEEITIEGYGRRVVMFELVDWAWEEKSLFLFLMDLRGNLCSAVELFCKIPEIQFEEEQLQ